MKKLLKVSLLMIVLCFAVPVYAEGDLPTGTKPTCTQNCNGGGLYEETSMNPTVTDETDQDDSTMKEIYSWIYEKISALVD